MVWKFKWRTASEFLCAKKAAVVTFPSLTDGAVFGAIVSAPVVIGWTWEVDLRTTLSVLSTFAPYALVDWASTVLNPKNEPKLAEVDTLALTRERLVGLHIPSPSDTTLGDDQLDALQTLAIEATGWGPVAAAVNALPLTAVGGPGGTVSLGGVVLVDAKTGNGIPAFKRKMWRRWESDPSSPVVAPLPHLSALSVQGVVDARLQVKRVLRVATIARTK